MRYADHIYAGARAILVDKESCSFRIVELLANKVNLTEDGLFFAVKDVKTGELIGAKLDNLRFDSRKRDEEGEDEGYCTIGEWIDDYDDEYMYNNPDPFNPFVLHSTTPWMRIR